MKALITAFTIFLVLNSFGQKEIKLPELDTKKNTYTLDFSPDPKEKKVISAYMKGTTEIDSLRFWAEGTILLQSVMVTVITEDKNNKIKVDIVKDHWKDSKINGYTKDGVFQESFNTANKFGIVITSEEPNIPFHLAVWTSGEHIPNMTTLYYPVSENNNTQHVKTINTNSSKKQSPMDVSTNSNSLMYIVIGALGLIAILLALILLKKKPSKTLSILLFLFLGQQYVCANASPSSSGVFEAASSLVNNADGVLEFFQNAQTVGNEIQRQLSPSDGDSSPQVHPAGGPRLPSSCLPQNIEYTDPNESNCACLDLAYRDLNQRRLNLERLRIVYAHAMKKINAGIAFGDNVSGIHGVSGLAWQSQKMIILKKSIPTLNKAYDDKYAEMIHTLEENLRKIEECEANLGYENWYNIAGFIYYQFMADKYKRN